jgi:phage host-nuclease inhibitor protein Gam
MTVTKEAILKTTTTTTELPIISADPITQALVEANTLDQTNANSALEEAMLAAPFLAAFPKNFAKLDRSYDKVRNEALMLQPDAKHLSLVKQWAQEDALRNHPPTKIEPTLITTTDRERGVVTFMPHMYYLSERGSYYDKDSGEIMGYKGPDGEFIPHGLVPGQPFQIDLGMGIGQKPEKEIFKLDTEVKIKWGLRRLLHMQTEVKALELELESIKANIEAKNNRIKNEYDGFLFRFQRDFQEYYETTIKQVSKGKSINLIYGVLKKGFKPASTKVDSPMVPVAVAFLKARKNELMGLLEEVASRQSTEHRKAPTALEETQIAALEAAIAGYDAALKIEESVRVSNIPECDKLSGMLPEEAFRFTPRHEEFSIEVKVSPLPIVQEIPE